MFPEDLTTDRLYTVWVGIREEAGLPGLRIHDCRHTWASQGVMNGVGLTAVGRLLGHRRRETTAIYAHLDDGALRDAAAQAASVIAGAMRYRAEPPPLPGEAADAGRGGDSDRPNIVDAPANPLDPVPAANRAGPSGGSKNAAKDPAHRRKMDWLGGPSVQTRSVTATRKRGKRPRRTGKDFY